MREKNVALLRCPRSRCIAEDYEEDRRALHDFSLRDRQVDSKAECSRLVLRLFLRWTSASDVDLVESDLLDGFCELQRHSAIAAGDWRTIGAHSEVDVARQRCRFTVVAINSPREVPRTK